MLRTSCPFWYRLFSTSRNPKKSFQRFNVSANSQCICAFGADKNCVVGENMFCVCTLLVLFGGSHVHMFGLWCVGRRGGCAKIGP